MSEPQFPGKLDISQWFWARPWHGRSTRKQIYHHRSRTCLPAQIGGKDVQQLISVYQRVEDGTVSTVDHVTLIGGPPAHLPVDKRLYFRISTISNSANPFTFDIKYEKGKVPESLN